MNSKDLRVFREHGIIDTRRMRVIDTNAIALGVTSLQLMEAAGKSLADSVRSLHPDIVLILAGKGNNGGDGLVAARYLQYDTDTIVWYYDHPVMSPECRHQLTALTRSAVTLYPFTCLSDLVILKEQSEKADVIIDALLGIGGDGDLREPIRTCVAIANRSPGRIIAADIPTRGMRTDHIVSFHREKVAGAETVDIGIPIEADCCTGPGDLTLIPSLASHAHKGAGGKILIIGGGPYQGAPWLAGLAAMRSGADLVRIASPTMPQSLDLIHLPLSGTHITEDHQELLIRYCEDADVVICGNGLGPQSHEVTCAIAPHCRRAVFDADALRTPLPVARENTLYTPHAGEFSRAFAPPGAPSLPDDPIQRAHLIRSATAQLADEKDTILLKGPIDIIADREHIRWNRTGTPAMTTGGTGDVLAGVCGALLCHLTPFESACAASYAIGRAGETGADLYGQGLVASDLIDCIAQVLYARGMQ